MNVFTGRESKRESKRRKNVFFSRGPTDKKHGPHPPVAEGMRRQGEVPEEQDMVRHGLNCS